MTMPPRTDDDQAYYSLSQRVYSAFAPFYDLVTFPFGRLRCEVVRLVAAHRDASVLDVATGTGAQALAFAEKCRRVVGIDLSARMLRVARRKDRRSRVRLVQADAVALPFADGRFDVSCVSFALHEMPLNIRRQVVREMARVTRPGGTVVVVDYGLPHGRVARQLVYHAVRLYEHDTYAEFVRADLGALLRDAGIAVRNERPTVLGAVRIVVGSTVATDRHVSGSHAETMPEHASVP